MRELFILLALWANPMPATAYHVFTNQIADGTNTQIVRPSDWNSAHAITLNASGSEISGAFGNGGGVTFGLSADGKITASAPAAGGGLTNINISAGTTSNNLSAFQFSNASGVSFGLNGSTVTASVKTDYLTTARASNDAVGLNTAITAGPLAWSVNSSGISLNAGSAAGTTSGFGGNLISGSMTHNTAGLNLSLNHPAWLTTAMASNAGSNFVAATAAFAGTNASGTIASNGISVSVDAPGGGATISEFQPYPGIASYQSNVAFGQNSIHFAAFDLPQYLSAYRVNVAFSVLTTVSAANSTGRGGITYSAALYGRDPANTRNITSFWSGSAFIAATQNSNTQIVFSHPLGISNSTKVSSSEGSISNANATTYIANSIGGMRMLPLPISSTLTPGRYYFAQAQSTSQANAGVLNFQFSGWAASYLERMSFNNFGTSGQSMGVRQHFRYSATSGAFPGTVNLATDYSTNLSNPLVPFFNFSAYTTATNLN